MSKQYSQLLYRRPYAGKGAEPETPEFIIRVFADEFKEWKKGNLIPSPIFQTEIALFMIM